MKYIIKSNYEYEIEANSKEEALKKWSENIEEELALQNSTLVNEFVESLEVKEEK
jgi:mannitol/fructose-specific phosphotransferase system IIA component (Ntr-type)